MKRQSRLLLACMALVWASTAVHAQGVIRFIASYGSDSNPCSRTAPCRTMQAGVTATPAGAELQVIDSGEYGPNVLINKSITISAKGVSASIVSTSGDAITVTASASDVVILRGLLLDGSGTAVNGVRVTAAGAVHIENFQIEAFDDYGIFQQSPGKLFVRNIVSRNNGSNGLIADLTSGSVVVTVDGSHFLNNGGNGLEIATSGSGSAEASISNSLAAGNVNDGFALAGTIIRMNLTNCTAANNLSGFSSLCAGTCSMNIESSVARGNSDSGMIVLTGVMRVANSTVTENAFGLRQVGSGTLASRSANNTAAAPGTNTVAGNTANTAGTITYYDGN